MPMRMAERAGPANGFGRAAGLRAIGALVRPELEGHGHDFTAHLPLGEGSHGRIDATADGDQDAVRMERSGRDQLAGGRERAERARQRVGDQVCRVAALRTEPADHFGDVSGRDKGGRQDTVRPRPPRKPPRHML